MRLLLTVDKSSASFSSFPQQLSKVNKHTKTKKTGAHTLRKKNIPPPLTQTWSEIPNQTTDVGGIEERKTLPVIVLIDISREMCAEFLKVAGPLIIIRSIYSLQLFLKKRKGDQPTNQL